MSSNRERKKSEDSSLQRTQSTTSVKSDGSESSTFKPNFVGWSPLLTSQDSMSVSDSFGASPALTQAKTKRKRKSEPKGIKMVHKKIDISEALTSSDEELDVTKPNLASPPAPSRHLGTAEERTADSTLTSGDVSDLDTEQTEKERKLKKKKKHKEKKKKKDESSPVPMPVEISTPSVESPKKKIKKSKKSTSPQKVVPSQVFNKSAHEISSASSDDDVVSSTTDVKKFIAESQGFSPKVSTVKKSPRKSPKKSASKKKRKKSQSDSSDSESEADMKSDTSQSSSIVSPKGSPRAQRLFSPKCTGNGMQTTDTPTAQQKLSGMSEDKFSLLEKRLKKTQGKGSGDSGAETQDATPTKKLKLDSPKRVAIVTSPKHSQGDIPSPVKSQKDVFVSPNKKRLSLSRKRKSMPTAGGEGGVGEKEILPDLVPTKKQNVTPSKPGDAESDATEFEGLGTQEMFQSQSKRAPTPEVQKMRIKQMASQKVQIGDVEIGESDLESEASGSVVGDSKPPSAKFKCPEGMEKMTYKKTSRICLENNFGPNKEAWLLRVPQGFDTSLLDGKDIKMSGTVVIHREIDAQNPDIEYTWEVQADTDVKLKNSGMLAVIPSKVDREFHAAGVLNGQISIRRSMNVKPVVIPEEKNERPQIPEGLKCRHKPFGTGYGVVTGGDSVDGGVSEKKKKKKKRRESEQGADMDVSGPTVKTEVTMTTTDNSMTTVNNSTIDDSGIESVVTGSSGKKKKKKKDKKGEKEITTENKTNVSMDTTPEGDSVALTQPSLSNGSEKKRKKKKHRKDERESMDTGITGAMESVKHVTEAAAEMDSSEPEFDLEEESVHSVSATQPKSQEKVKKKKHKVKKDK